MPTSIEFKNISKRSNQVLLASYIAIASLLALQIATLFELSLLEDIKRGNYNSLEQLDSRIANNDLWIEILNLASALAFIFYIVLFFMWIYRTNSNSHTFTQGKIRHTPGWSVGWFFIPIANLWKSYKIPAEIWKASKLGPDYNHTHTTPLFLKLWWVAWIADNLFSQISLRITDSAVEPHELINADRILFSSNIVSIISIILTIKMVKEINLLQENQSNPISEVFA